MCPRKTKKFSGNQRNNLRVFRGSPGTKERIEVILTMVESVLKRLLEVGVSGRDGFLVVWTRFFIHLDLVKSRLRIFAPPHLYNTKERSSGALRKTPEKLLFFLKS